LKVGKHLISSRKVTKAALESRKSKNIISAAPRSRSQPTMPYPKKWTPILSFLTVAVLIWIFKPLLPTPRIVWDMPGESRPRGPVGVTEIHHPAIRPPAEWDQDLTKARAGRKTTLQAQEPMSEEERAEKIEKDNKANLLPATGMPFRAGIPKAIGEPYTKALIVPRTKDEDVNWIEENFGGSTSFRPFIYTVDNFDSEYHPPKNKGHEVMVYLSYIIDNYDNLSDVNMFMHSHRHAWHNDDLLDNDAVQMISRLSSERVTREGFMNMRCHWDPGCPDWMHPGTVEEDINKQEETILARSWSEIFPLDPIPEVLAQPCCAQFAISRDRIRSLPLARYVFYRDWLLRTSMSDYISGRVWEYVWQFVFTGKNVVCPKEHICYCDGFGVCFGGEEQYTKYYERHDKRARLEDELKVWNEQHSKWISTPENEQDKLEFQEPEIGKNIELQGRISALTAWCDQKRQQAKEHGDVAMNRAKEAGRPWADGDGF
jgi:hypothetical protein